MSTKKPKKSKSQPTSSSERTREKGQKTLEKILDNGELHWIESHDGRLMPLELLHQSDNKELAPDRYYKTAEMLLGNPLVFYLYGLNEEGIIKAGLFGHYNPMDNCLYLENFFNVSPKEKAILPILNAMKIAISADKVKQIKTKILEIGE